jgi:putative ABC transport system substrate-binding protein
MFGMRRREFLSLLGGAAAARSLPANAQQRRQMRRIGIFVSGAEGDPEMEGSLGPFKQELRRRGWSEGENLRIDYRFLGGRTDQVEPIARELIALQPDAILVRGTPLAVALKRQSRTVPIVFVGVSDPVGAGLVTNLPRPTGNVTGHLLYEEGIPSKWLALLKEIAPHLARAALIANPGLGPYDYFLRSARAAAASLALDLIAAPVGSAADIERTVETVARLPNSGLVVPPDPMIIIHRDLFISLAAKYRLPAVYGFRVFTAAGGLMSYDSDIIDHYLAAAVYVDRILRGTRPADLPVQTPIKYQTIVNLRTAKALGLDVPPSLLVRADTVIE